MRISKLIAFSILRIVGFRRCPAVSLSNAGSACKVILNLGFSLSRTPILQEPTRQPAGSSAKPTDTPPCGEFGEGNRPASQRGARRSQPTRQPAGSSPKAIVQQQKISVKPAVRLKGTSHICSAQLVAKTRVAGFTGCRRSTG